jgi:hypothetical protein
LIAQQFYINDTIITGSTIIFVLTTIVFIVIYYRKLFYASREYNDSKNIISGIILTFRHRQNEQDEKIDNIVNDIEKLHSFTESLPEKSNRTERMINGLITSVKSAFMINKKLTEHITTMKEEISNISKTQQNMQKQIASLEESAKTPEPLKIEATREEKGSSVELTETENQIIQFLLTGGPKTAPEVERKIEKTREHTARLMKKLWQEGFIERDTHRIPFIYRANEKLKERIVEKTDSV